MSRKLKIGRKKIKQYTVADVMRILSISKVTALKILKSGQLKSVRIGRQYWINEDDLLRYLLGGRDRVNENTVRSKSKNPLQRLIVKLFLKR